MPAEFFLWLIDSFNFWLILKQYNMIFTFKICWHVVANAKLDIKQTLILLKIYAEMAETYTF